MLILVRIGVNGGAYLYLDWSKQEVLSWIYPLDTKTKHQSIRAKRVSESGKWFLNHEVYQRWLNNTTISKIYCPGARENPFVFALIILSWCRQNRPDVLQVLTRRLT